ncbi:hypothetical protein [Bradyrhizobium erythrophlei]|uniref:Uncharacterized protein n=1 Tax=Bradyrhizobium erythrophlei TaxID=1437360 RepID=A0A1M5NKQ4_9BRAD|nr:hypothetical protein [Bradyrhizobium erythrophlei]SHG90130.1 hypothetical protein SAMN05443248_3033 [Bradyrhizobium erythrophlei]
MTSKQIVNLRVGQMVRTKHMPDRFWKITKVYVPTGGGRVLELEGALWIGPSQVEEVLPS